MSSESIKILLIEEDSTYISCLREPLQEAEHSFPYFTLVHVNSLEQAFASLAEADIDIILLDLCLPDAQGIQALQQVRERVPDIPIVVLTDGDEQEAAYALQHGAQDYLIKERLWSDSLVHALLCSIERHDIWGMLQYYSQEVRVRESHFQLLINKNPDGVVVVDVNGIVRFVNPSAETLFGHTAEELHGELFGFPIIAGEATEIDVFQKGSEAQRIAEMRVVETEWEGEFAYLISIRDVTDRKNLEESLRESEEFNRLILDSIDEHVIVIDKQGIVVSVNNWKSTNRNHKALLDNNFRVGANYYEICRRVFGESSQMSRGISAVFNHESETFNSEVRLYLSGEEFWFHVCALPLRGIKQNYVVVSLHDVTERKRIAWAEAEARSNAERVKEQEREIRGLLQLSSSPTSVTAGLFGSQPLRESGPLVFGELTRQYGSLIEKAMEQRAYKVDYSLSEDLRAMAERLGFLRAGPRDVVEIHSTVLQQKSSGVNPLKAQAYTEEGRLLVLELMGHLVAYYRNYSLGMSKTFTPQPSA